MSPPPITTEGFAFGRHISPTRGQKLNGNDLRFTFERQHTKDALPYWQQGDEDFNRTLPSAQRQKSQRRRDPRAPAWSRATACAR